MSELGRNIRQGMAHHIYQKSYDGGVIFYKEEDYLLFYTVLSVTAKKCDVTIIGLCIMINHIHILVRCNTKTQLSSFVSKYSISFARQYNSSKNRKGPVFSKPFGSAPKVGKKSVMTAISYLGNNPVLKQQCNRAEDYRWGFIPYALSNHPFSKLLVVRNASCEMKKSIQLLKCFSKRNLPLNYKIQEIIFHNINRDERNQMIDLIIASYNIIDYKTTVSYYGNYEQMTIAINSNSGSEYEIKEEWDSYSYKEYEKMVSIAERKGYGGRNGFNFQKVEKGELIKLAKYFIKHTNASSILVAKFLHYYGRF